MKTLNLETISITQLHKVYSIYHISNLRLNRKIVIQFMYELSEIGYKCSDKLIKYVSNLNENDFLIFKNNTLEILYEMKNLNFSRKPLYEDNFPSESTPDTTIIILDYMKQYYNYMFDENLEIGTKKTDKKPLNENYINLTEIDICNTKDLINLFFNRIYSSSSLSEDIFKENEYLFHKLINNTDKVKDININEISIKENLSWILKLLYKSNNIENIDLKTSNDILRLAISLSEGDITFALNSKFKLSNGEKRSLLKILEKSLNKYNFNQFLEDAYYKRQKWLRLGEYIHPYKYRKKYEKSYKFFDVLRNNYKVINRFHSKWKNADSVEDKIQILSSRPGEFARNFFHLLYDRNTRELVIEKYNSIINKLTTKMLLKHIEELSYLEENHDYRFFMLKGVSGKTYLKNKVQKSLPKVVIYKIKNIILQELETRFSTNNIFTKKKIYIDPELKNIALPYNIRNQSLNNRMLTKNSSIKLMNTTNTLRFFVHWFNTSTNRVDIDIGGIFFDKEFNLKEILNWNHFHNSDISSFSGDIVTAPRPKGASEYIDINIEKAKAKGYRYIAITLNDFTNVKFSNIECKTGIMLREDPNSGETYESSTEELSFQPTSTSSGIISFIYDTEESVIHWIDLNLNISTIGSRLTKDSKHYTDIINIIVNKIKCKVSMYNLIYLYAKSNNIRVMKKLYSNQKRNIKEVEIFNNTNVLNKLYEISRKWIK